MRRGVNLVDFQLLLLKLLRRLLADNAKRPAIDHRVHGRGLFATAVPITAGTLRLTAVHLRVPVSRVDNVLAHLNGSIDAVQFVVEAAGVAGHLLVRRPPPHGAGEGATVGALLRRLVLRWAGAGG